MTAPSELGHQKTDAEIDHEAKQQKREANRNAIREIQAQRAKYHANTKWSPELDAQLRSLIIESRMTRYQIAEELGIHHLHIKWRLEELGLWEAQKKNSRRYASLEYAAEQRKAARVAKRQAQICRHCGKADPIGP